MTDVKTMRSNLGQPGSLPKTNEQSPLKEAISLRRKKNAMKMQLTDINSPDLNKPNKLPFGDENYNE